MKKKNTKANVLLSSLVGLVMVTGLVHARALESNIEDGLYLRPNISPYVSYPDNDFEQGKNPSLTSSYGQEIGSTSIDQEDTSNSSVDESQFINFLKDGFSTTSLTLQKSDFELRSLFNALTNKLRFNKNRSEAIMSDIKVQTNSATSVTLLWELNKFVNVTIFYSASSDVQGNSVTSMKKVPALTFMNQATLENLEPNTTYNYLVVINYKNKEDTTVQGSFRTAPQ